MTEEHLNYILSRKTIIESLASKFQLGPNPDYCYSALAEFGYENLVKFIDVDNPSRSAPYHGALHIASMVSCVSEAICYYKNLLLLGEKISLLLASSLHDVDHTAGVSADYLNIQRALTFLQGKRHLFSHHEIENVIFARAVKLIKTTEFPYKDVAVDLTEEIMRDADLMMIYLILLEDKSIAVNMFHGLYKEMKVMDPDLKFKTFIDNFEKFHRNIKWKTKWAQDKAEALNFNKCLEKLSFELHRLIVNGTEQ